MKKPQKFQKHQKNQKHKNFETIRRGREDGETQTRCPISPSPDPTENSATPTKNLSFYYQCAVTTFPLLFSLDC